MFYSIVDDAMNLLAYVAFSIPVFIVAFWAVLSLFVQVIETYEEL